PSGIQITYAVDGRNRRTGVSVNGTLVQGFLYGDGPQPLAQLDAHGAVVATYLYGTGNAPDAILQHRVTYRLLKDHRASARHAPPAARAAPLQRLASDPSARLPLDPPPGFQPFAFAGALSDPPPGLPRFGARDYDPETARWTAKAPLGFAA